MTRSLDHALRVPLTSRRTFIGTLSALGATVLASACGGGDDQPWTAPTGGDARLGSRPTTPSQAAAAGSYELTVGNANDGVLVIPPGLPAGPAPLVIVLHGAGQGAAWSRTNFTPIANARRFVMLAPGARGLTWDAMTYRYSYDVAFIDKALAFAFQRVAIEPARITLLGFSDGASYALGLGAANGDWIPRVIAFSPGMIAPSDSPRAGKSLYFVSHGTQDNVLNINRTSRVLVPALRSAGYTVRYDEFTGGHEIPAAILDAAWAWAGL